MKTELVSVVVQGLFFNEVVGIRKAIKILLTELVSQCRNILPLAFQGWIGYAGTHVPMFVHKLGLIKPRQT